MRKCCRLRFVSRQSFRALQVCMASPGSFASMHRLDQGGSAAAGASDSEATVGHPDELHPGDTKKGGAVAVEALVIA